jgi:hypothetical protein
MLPQFRALEVADAETLRVSTKRSTTGGLEEATKLLLNMVEGSGAVGLRTCSARDKARKG